MFTPRYYITNKILKYVIDFEIAFRDINAIPLPLKQKQNFYNQMRTENLFYIAKLLGIDISLKEANKIFVGKEINVFQKPKVLLVNYRSSLEFIKQMMKDRYITLSVGTFLHLNKIITNNWIDSWNCGRFRNIVEEPNELFDKWAGYHCKDNSLKDIQNYITDLMDWIKETRFMIHPLIKIAITFSEIFKIAPFFAGNQLTLLAFTEMLYAKFGIWQKGLIPISRHFYTYEEEYLESLIVCRESDDLTMWIERFIKGVSLDMQNIKNQMYQIEKEKVQQKKKMLLGLNSRQLQVLNYLKKNLKIARKDYTRMMGISFMSSYRDLNELLKRKLIYQYGKGRSTYYTLNPKEEIIESIDFDKERFKSVGTVTDEEIFTLDNYLSQEA